MQIQKKIILVLARYYLPGDKAGGPIRSLSNMVTQLGDEFDFRIVTSDRDLLSGTPYPGVVVNAWNQVGNAKVYYLSPGSRSILAFKRLLSGTPHDVLYLNSFFDPIFTQQPLLLRRLGLLPSKPVVIAPRGEFSPGALLIKHWKKSPYIQLASACRLYNDLTWHASSVRERDDIKASMAGPAQRIAIAIAVASDVPASLDENEVRATRLERSLEQPLRIVFLSRIAAMKNLDFALRVLTKVDVSVNFHIFGPLEDDPYWSQCEALMAALPPNIVARYEGAVNHSQVARILSSHDLLFLPTRGENYGHVIIESLSVGTPVLIADTTPWRDLEREGVGWVLPLDTEQLFADKIRDIAQISAENFVHLREKAYLYARKRTTDPEVIASNRRLFESALALQT